MRFRPNPAVPRRTRLLPALVLLVAACSDGPTAPRSPDPLVVPPIAREFRGMWIATVANIDWPSSPSLSAAQQKAELDALLDVAQQTGLNAVVLQVRAAGDALYGSTIEPWAKSLAGTQGVSPGYDPLDYAVTQAHLRGLELHAWFNPFRAANLTDTATLSPKHFAKERPDLARVYCTQLWFDPGAEAVHDRAVQVILDVVARYDVDAVHLDDFFYPYPNAACPGLDFPDSVTYADYLGGGGSLGRAEWRRANVNRFVQRLYMSVRGASSHVQVGISPFGIWRPGNPAGVTGLDAYASIYADSRLWLQSGWVDYFSPQLYWAMNSTGQSFPALLAWWGQQNTLGRHLWPGLAGYRVADGTGSAFSSGEIPAQVAQVRTQTGSFGGASGTILYNASSVRTDRGGYATALRSGAYATGAIPPATTWLDAVPPAPPTLQVTANGTSAYATMTGGSGTYWWLVRWRANGVWDQRRVFALTASVTINAAGIDAVAVHTLDRSGNASEPATWQR